MITVFFFSMPRFSASSIMAMPMRSFTLPSGLKNSHLSRMVRLQAGGDFVEPDQGSVADGFDDVVIDARHKINQVKTLATIAFDTAFWPNLRWTQVFFG